MCTGSIRGVEPTRRPSWNGSPSVRCWVDPEEPARVVFARGYTWWMWLLLVLPASFLILGGAGATRAVLQSLTSAERRAAMSQRAARMAPFEEVTGRRAQFPSLPPEDMLTDSPGTRLAYRLPAQSAPQWALTGILLLCLFWNGIVLWIAVGIFQDDARGASDSSALLVVLPFAVVGVWLAWQFVRKARRMTGIGTTRVEISGHPLLPGQSYRILLSQSGRRHIDRLEALLVCEEEATYRQGTDTRTARQTVYQVPVYRRDQITIRTAVPFEDQCDVEVPADAMHSFKSDHNEVQWELVVRAAVAGWPPSERRFPVVVYPGASPSVARRSAS